MSSDAHAHGHHDDDHIHPPPSNWFTKYVWTYDHKIIGKQYLYTALVFLLIGGLFAMMLRWNLAYPGKPMPVVGSIMANTSFCNADGSISDSGFNQLTTMHGTIMVFFVIIPLVVGAFGNFLIPLHVGARDVAFPFLNALSYWLYFLASVIVIFAFFVKEGPAGGGWTAYPPISDLPTAAPGSGAGQIIVLSSIFVLGFSSIVGGLNFMTTITMMRAPGLTWSRLPLVTWAQFITSVFQVLATPVLAAAACMLLFDKFFDASFFIPSDNALAPERTGGGHPLLWQHLFWFYAHPAVYILILPAMGIASEIISTFARKPIFGYKAMVVSMTAIMGLGFIVWGHHMFVSGMNPYMGRAFMISTMFIALPSAVKTFNWLGTIYKGSIQFHSAMLCGLAFVAMFVIGGLSGIFMAAAPVDIFIHDTYYVVAHFHYVVFGGTLFAIFGGVYFWFPKMYGRLMNEGLAKLHVIITFIAFNCTFFPMHFLGEAGAMRRVFSHVEYDFLSQYQWWNVFITMSAFTLGAAQLIFIFNVVWSSFFGKKEETGNPWKSATLEWCTPHPLPYYNFDEIPVVNHGPYEYSRDASEGAEDWVAQTDPAGVLCHGGTPQEGAVEQH
jgi:cytochrome c oxidase subunit 1